MYRTSSYQYNIQSYFNKESDYKYSYSPEYYCASKFIFFLLFFFAAFRIWGKKRDNLTIWIIYNIQLNLHIILVMSLNVACCFTR